MNKRRNEELIQKAENALRSKNVKMLDNEAIKDSYNGQTASLGVTIAMTGLRPALAIYQKKTDECDKLQILNAIAFMMGIDCENAGKELYRNVLDGGAKELKKKTKEIIDCSVALKQVIRTYELKK